MRKRGITAEDMRRWGWIKDDGTVTVSIRAVENAEQEKPVDWTNIVPTEKNASAFAIRDANPDTASPEHGKKREDAGN